MKYAAHRPALFANAKNRNGLALKKTQGIKLMKTISMGSNLDGIWKSIVILVGITLICSVISVKTFRWE